jgi:hypothetical protein
VQVRSGETTAVGDFVLEPEPGTVTGTVTDVNTGNPIPNARVTAVAGATTRADVTTDANGVYTFTVPAGEYVVTAVAPGYAPESQTLTVPANTTTTLDFRLALLPPGSASGRIVRRFGGAPEPGVTVRLRFGNGRGANRYAPTRTATTASRMCRRANTPSSPKRRASPSSRISAPSR